MHAPERVRGMVVEMPVLDNALLGCAIAFTPLMVALTFGEPVMRLVARGARQIPTRRRPAAGRRRPGHHPPGPGPSAAVLHGLFFGRTAPHKALAPRARGADAGHRPPARPGPPLQRLRRAGRRAAQRDASCRPARSSSCSCARSASPARSATSSTRAGRPGAAAVRRARAASPRLPGRPWPIEPKRRNAGARSASPRRRRPARPPPASARCRSAAARCWAWP